MKKWGIVVIMCIIGTLVAIYNMQKRETVVTTDSTSSVATVVYSEQELKTKIIESLEGATRSIQNQNVTEFQKYVNVSLLCENISKPLIDQFKAILGDFDTGEVVKSCTEETLSAITRGAAVDNSTGSSADALVTTIDELLGNTDAIHVNQKGDVIEVSIDSSENQKTGFVFKTGDIFQLVGVDLSTLQSVRK